MKTITHALINVIAIAVTAYILPGVHIASAVALFVLAVVLAVINTFIRPVLVILTLPLSIFTLGLFTLILNTLLIMIAANIVPGVSIDGFLWAFVFGIVLALIGAVLHGFEK